MEGEMREWIAQMEEERSKVEIHELPRMEDKSGFYKTPSYVKVGQDESLFRPQKVSIGPYHHGAGYCEEGERVKQKCLPFFLRRSDVPLQVHIDRVGAMVDDLRGMYHNLDANRWLGLSNTYAFLRMMILDACFILEVMVVAVEVLTAISTVGYAFDDLNDLETYKCDMLIFDNQIPFQVLNCICETIHQSWMDNLMLSEPNALLQRTPSQLARPTQLIRDAFQPESLGQDPDPKTVLHVLDVYWRILCCKEYTEPPSGSYIMKFSGIPSATQLEQAQIGISLHFILSGFRILFQNKALMLPEVVVDDATCFNFHNVILYEQLHPRARNHCSTCIYALKCLLKDAADSRLLRTRGLLNTTLPDEKVIELFNGLSKSIFKHRMPMNHTLSNEMDKVADSYRKNLKPWRQDLLQKYLRSPWAIISIFVGFVIFTFTGLQTVYTMLGYYKGE